MFPGTFCTLRWHVTATPDTRLHTSNRACLSWLLFIPVQTCDWPSVNKLRRPRGAVHGAEIKDFHLTALHRCLCFPWCPMITGAMWATLFDSPFPRLLLYLHLQTYLVFSLTYHFSTFWCLKSGMDRGAVFYPVGFQLKCAHFKGFVKVFGVPGHLDC